VDGDSLEAALRDYGPAAIDDLLPRLRTIAETLDAAHAAGQIHGSLHPQNIFVSADHTQVEGLDTISPVGDAGRRPPYVAPEVTAGGDAQAASDQFSLAAIAHEWMFGRRIAGPAVRPIEVRSLPGVDRDALARAFTRALAPQAADRFASCTAFCAALEATLIPVLPLGIDVDEDALETEFLPEDEAAPPVVVEAETETEAEAEAEAEPELETETEAEFDTEIEALPLIVSDDFAINLDRVAEPEDTPAPKAIAAFEPKLSPPVEPVTSWQPSAAYTPAKPTERFSGAMLIVAALVGMVVGFAGGYMARPRALQSGPLANASKAADAANTAPTATPGTEAAVLPAPVASGNASVAGKPPAPAPTAAPEAPKAPASIGRLLVRSSPSGASVEVDGVARGVTPLALRDLELGSRTIVVTRRGYIAEERKVALTRTRPSRSLELRLTAEPSAAPRPTTPATLGKPAARVGTGSLLIESRPTGAAVSIDGQPRGVTPLTIEALPPGDYRIGLSLAGYQSFATTVRVVAGERTRAAASLSVQE
jgi:hypothetical protein